MGAPRDGGLTPKEQAFSLNYFKTNGKRPGLSAMLAGYPSKSAGAHATEILQRQRVKDYLRKLWEAAESPIVMSVRERKEKLSLIARGMVGDCVDEGGNIDWGAVKEMPAVKEVTIEERDIGEATLRTIRVKLLNPVESIHELNLMEKLYRTNEQSVNINPTYNYFVTDGTVVEKLGRIGERTQKEIALTGGKVEEGERL
ncbi:hypothetical protein LCGC14_0684610 [marine sediment metagenome]|uniref:Terminase small subunit n=1 Tax=marine sediment metagenome TaxID=412755 RepID=A0A0F9QMC4_9ZZZZ